MLVIDLNEAYKISMSSVVCPIHSYNVTVSYEQGRAVVAITVCDSEYVIMYGSNKIIIEKELFDTDLLFQLCTVHEFDMYQLYQMIRDSESIYKLVVSL